jgi:hypothetical protein
MNKNLNLDLSCSLVEAREIDAYEAGLETAKKRLLAGNEPFTGWVGLPFTYDRKELKTS